MWYVLVIANGDLLYTIQDFSPWLGTTQYFLDALRHPGGLREWAGDWFTQLFYYPWLGGSIMLLMWVITALSLVRACRLKHGFELLSLVPVLALLAGITQLGYWVFCLKTVSYWFGPTLGALCIGLFALSYSRANHVARCILLAAWGALAIPALGWYGTLGLLVGLLLTPMRQTWKEWGQLLSPAFIALISVMYCYANSAGTQINQPLLWYGFPKIIIPEASAPLLEVAPWVMTVAMLVLPLVRHLQHSVFALRAALPVSILVLVVALGAANMLNYRNSNFHAELKMLRAMNEGRWDDLLLVMRNLDRKPTREMVMMKDVALAQKGQLATQAFNYDVRGVRPAMNVALPIHMAHSAGPVIYYWLGMPNYAYMWAMENKVEYGLSPYWLRLFYRCAVVNGEENLARKYKALLETTLFHNELEVSAEEIDAIRSLAVNRNELTNDGGYSESFLMSSLCKNIYDTPKAQEIALHYALLMRQPELFAMGLDIYVSMVGNDKPLPVTYQEALLLFVANQTQNDHEVMASLPVSEDVRRRFDLYRAAVQQTLQLSLSAERAGEQLYSRYGQTYWWYYDLYTNNKTY